MAEYTQIVHPISPLFNNDSRVLILGSFPSVKSRETGFYYGHPQNRFWPLMARLFKESLPVTVSDKRALVQKHRIALWDVIGSCEIIGSSDNSIKNVVANDIKQLIDVSNIVSIFTNGSTADSLYKKYIQPSTEIEAVKLPSTSPANAAYSIDRLAEIWSTVVTATHSQPGNK